MPAIDLVFKKPWKAGNPVDLVFGDDGGGSGIPDAALVIAARVPGLRARGAVHVRKDLVAAARMPGVRCQGVVRYNTDTSRPITSTVATLAQHAVSFQMERASGWHKTLASPSSWMATAAEAQPLQMVSSPSWQEAKCQGLIAGVRFEQAQQLNGPALLLRWQEAQSVRQTLQVRFEDALQVPFGLQMRFEEALRDRRLLTITSAQSAQGLQTGVSSAAGPAVSLFMGSRARYQDAMRPPPGISFIRPDPPNPDEHCYEQLVGGPIELLFCKLWEASTALVFACCKSSGPQPGKVIVPVRKVYVVLNQVRLIRLDTGAELPALGFSMSLDYQSWTWNWSASLHKDAAAHLGRDAGGDPAQFLVNVNGVEFKLRLERMGRDRSFMPQERWSVSGRGLAAVLSEPWAKSMPFGNPNQALTAQQLAIEALKVNGVPIGWGIDWQLQDWSVPAGAWALQGTYIDAINDIASAVGAYVQPHNTEQILRILPKYPTAPWAWGDVIPDFEIPAAAAEVEGTEFTDKPVYNNVFVGGISAGVFGPIKRAGTAGDLIAPQVTHALITETSAQRQRGLAELADTGRQALVTLSMQVLPETGVIMPGQFVRYVGPETVQGIVRSTSLSWAAPKLRQSMEIETHA